MGSAHRRSDLLTNHADDTLLAQRTTQILALRPSTIASQVLQVPSLQSYLILMPDD